MLDQETERLRLYTLTVLRAMRTMVSAKEIDRDEYDIKTEIVLQDGKRLHATYIEYKAPGIIGVTAVEDATKKDGPHIMVLVSPYNFQLVLTPAPKNEIWWHVKFGGID